MLDQRDEANGTAFASPSRKQLREKNHDKPSNANDSNRLFTGHGRMRDRKVVVYKESLLDAKAMKQFVGEYNVEK